MTAQKIIIAVAIVLHTFLQSVSVRKFHQQGARPCSAKRKSRCCGDGICGKTEDADNCPADCASDDDAGAGGRGGRGGGGKDKKDKDGADKDSDEGGDDEGADASDKPQWPTLCSPLNMGKAPCGTRAVKTWVFWTQEGKTQRWFHTVNMPTEVPATGPMPVIILVDGYTAGKKPSESGKSGPNAAAEYYGFVLVSIGNVLKDGGGGFGLMVGNNNIANDANPMPCSRKDSREVEYLEALFNMIADNPMLDEKRVYFKGFSQNSGFAIWAAVCFADRVAGLWQGGAGLRLTGWAPLAPGKQGQCSFSSMMAYGNDCCEKEFCTECQYFPLWPRTCSNKLVDCVASYTNDAIGCGSDWMAYDAMVKEGNDARLLSFAPSDGAGSHQDPKNAWAWVAGCLAISPSCSKECAVSFGKCVNKATDRKSYDKFATCENQLKAGSLTDCKVGCSPTLDMLKSSEEVAVSLSQGKFGDEADLQRQDGPAPKPKCKKDWGPLSEFPDRRCEPPSGWTPKEPSPKKECESR